MSDMFLAHLPDLVTIESKQTSGCDSRLCWPIIAVRTLKQTCLRIKDPYAVTQKTVDAVIKAYADACSSSIALNIVEDFPEESGHLYTPLSMHDVDTDEDTTWFACRGTRSYRDMYFSSLPYLLVLNTESIFAAKTFRAILANTITVEGTEYHLAAMMYSNGSHFCCTVVIKERAMFYDGLKNTALRWAEMDEKPVNFFLCEAWYLRGRRVDGVEPEQEPTTQSGTAPSAAPKADADDWNWTEEDHNHQYNTTVKASSDHKKYPLGFSIHCVAKTGVLPKCAGCGEQMERSHRRLVLRKFTDEERGFTGAQSFHTRQECLFQLSKEKQEMAIREIEI